MTLFGAFCAIKTRKIKRFKISAHAQQALTGSPTSTALATRSQPEAFVSALPLGRAIHKAGLDDAVVVAAAVLVVVKVQVVVVDNQAVKRPAAFFALVIELLAEQNVVQRLFDALV